MSKQQSELSDLNLVMNYLADAPTETIFPNEKSYELLILAGNSLPILTAEVGQLLKTGKVCRVLLSGGIGHATHFLREKFQKIGYDFPETISEAQMNQLYLIEEFGILKEQLLIEGSSTNSGENASFSLDTAQEVYGENLPSEILLTNDPLLQKRTKATFQMHWPQEIKFINFVPIIPQANELTPKLKFESEKLNSAWPQDYFFNLVLGEHARLKNDASGYGPKGKGFMTAVDMPKNISEAFTRLTEKFDYNLKR